LKEFDENVLLLIFIIYVKMRTKETKEIEVTGDAVHW
jgi:hypothetical protein